MNFRKTELACGIAAGVMALALGAPAFAQDMAAEAAAEDTVTGNAIIVTANMREETLQEVPIAVSVVSGEQLQAAGVSAVEGLVQVSPSLTFTQGDNPGDSSLNIRGIGTTVFSVATEPAVSIVVDDVVMARAGQGFQDLIDVQRVEVLRGPQSTLFGKNASAGLVSVTTSDPTSYLSGKVDGSFAQGGEWQARGIISGPVAKDAGLSVSGYYKDFDGFIDNVSGIGDDKLGGYRNYGGRAKFVYEPHGDLKITLIGDYRNGTNDASPTLRAVDGQAYADAVSPVVPSAKNRDVNLNADTTNDSEQWGVSGRVQARLNDDLQLVSITAVRGWDFTARADVDYTSLSEPVPGVNLWDVNTGTTSLKQYSQELRVVSDDLGGFDVLFGGYAFLLDLDTGFQRRQIFPTGPRSGQFTGSTKNTNLAVFASTNIYLTDTLEMFGGLRLLHETLDWDVYRDPSDVLVAGDSALGGATGVPADFDGKTSDTALVGKIGLRYQLGSLGNAYASYSRGYKGKGFNLIFGAQESYEPVDAEQSDAFEIGAKLQSLDGVWSLNAALFYTKYKNFQSQAQLPGDVAFYLLNAGSTSTKGIELEGTVRPTSLTTLNLGMTLLDARIDSFPLGPCYRGQTAAEGCVDGVQDLSGGDLPNAPDFRLTGSLRQTVPFGDSAPVDGFVMVDGSYQTKVSYQIDQNPRAAQGGFGLVNLSAGVESKDDSYSVTVFVRNLFDQNNVSNIFDSGFNGGRTYQQVLRDGARYWGVRASYSF
ncbi:TonB-dependent receptor [Novosphingobium profundi]|uniref:TonB-dependent receptor n=1 Tax=Novosphingobium profundi TaxID=1774954 RepID=UPI001CFF3843|nr:TonB-dependent receptor [Novosphingobium profundi]